MGASLPGHNLAGNQIASRLVGDEPAHDLDIETLQRLESLPVDDLGTMLLVSRDRARLNDVAASTLVIEDDGLVKEQQASHDGDLQDIPFDPDLYSERTPVNPRFERHQGVEQFLFDLFDIRRETAIQLTHAKVNHRAVRLLVIRESGLPDGLVRKVPNRIEKPLQIAQYARPVALNGNDPLVTALHASSRVIVGKSVEQAGLQFIERGDRFGHSFASLYYYRCN